MSRGSKKHTLLLIISALLIIVGLALSIASYSKPEQLTKTTLLYNEFRESDFQIYLHFLPNEIYPSDYITFSTGVPIYASLVNEIVVNQTEKLSGGSFSGNATYTIALVHPDGWTKNYYLSSMNVTGMSSFSKTFVLNLSEVTSYMDYLSRQAGLRLTSYNISISSSGPAEILIGGYRATSVFSHELVIKVDLSRNRIEIGTPLHYSANISKTNSTIIQNSISGMSVSTARTLSILISIAGTASLFLYVAVRESRASSEQEKFEKKYGSIIIKGSTQNPLCTSTRIELKDPEELVKASKILERPIVAGSEGEYIVNDRDICYVYKFLD
ncbi:MAG: DUF5305 family protein [Fervidicoccaceae archaeon]